MLSIYSRLFKRIEQKSIPYCSWKNNHLLLQQLSGFGDMDILVHPRFKHSFELVLNKSRFIRVNSSVSEYPSVYHFYAYDANKQKFAHLHVYYKLVTGDSHLKNYRIPLEEEVINSSFTNNFGIREASAIHQMRLYLIRKAIKVSTLTGVLLWFREREDYINEYQYIRTNLSDNTIDANLLSLPCKACFFRKMKISPATVICLKVSMFSWSRGVGLKERAFQLIKRVLNKIYFHRKKSLNGNMIALVGVDGSGKSTAIKMIQKWLGSEFNVKSFHFGRPPATFVTFPIRVALQLRQRLGKGKSVAFVRNTKMDGSLDFIGKLRYSALAYERSVLIGRAHRYSLNGGFAIVDRYSSTCLGLMDSPRIAPDNSSSYLHSALQKIECVLYNSMPLADLLLKLDVDVQNALVRNRNRTKKNKETDAEIMARYEINKHIEFNSLSLVKIDANQKMELVHQQLRKTIWNNIIDTN